MVKNYIFIMVFVCIVGCAQEPPDNSGLDLSVGNGSIDGASISVDGGLGAIQVLQSGYIELWLQSPTISINLDLTGSVVEDWQIVLKNSVANMSHLNPGDVNSSLNSSQTGNTYSVDINATAGSTYRLDFSTSDNLMEGIFSFAVLSDIQKGVDEVQDIYNAINSDSSLRFVVSAGDLTETGTRGEMNEFRDKLSLLHIPFYSTPGNHDMFDGQHSYWRSVFGRASFTFRYKGITYIFADTSEATIEKQVYGWIEDWSQTSINDLQFFIAHYPAIDPCGARSGGLSSRNEAYKLIATLGKGGVDVIVNGHIHSYYHFDTAGIDTYISGGGGAYPELYDGIERHFLKVMVTGSSNSYSVIKVEID